MDGLRWLLLFFGLLVIAGVYLYSRREKSSSEGVETSLTRLQPSLDGNHSAHMPDVSAEVESPSVQKIVTLRLVARKNKPFEGDKLILTLRGIGLRHGKFGIFHRYDGSEEGGTIFSAASLVEPGSFDLEKIGDQEIPGISLFLVIPGPIDSVEGFDLMMAAARTLAQSLHGELLDESGSTLSIQRERYLREEIIQFQHSNLVA